MQAEQPTSGHAGRVLGVTRLALGADSKLTGQDWQPHSMGPEVPDDPTMAGWVSGLPR